MQLAVVTARIHHAELDVQPVHQNVFPLLCRAGTQLVSLQSAVWHEAIASQLQGIAFSLWFSLHCLRSPVPVLVCRNNPLSSSSAAQVVRKESIRFFSLSSSIMFFGLKFHGFFLCILSLGKTLSCFCNQSVMKNPEGC